MRRLYLDTSVISAYYDDREPEKRAQTREFWKKLKDYEVYISEITITELNREKSIEKRDQKVSLVMEFYELRITEKVGRLVDAYLEHNIIPKKYEGDALHIAIAIINDIDILVSWNFKHIVKLKTKREVNAISILEGYKTIEIICPLEL
ncbi:MAG: PIN domain-containing protein [Candidatus Stahlbacteria bacterium]|nr:PIN domain-containing protein [Candidatus Stahlbacteria bacterium]